MKIDKLDMLQISILQLANGKWVKARDVELRSKGLGFVFGGDRLRYSLDQMVQHGYLIRKFVDGKTRAYTLSNRGEQALAKVQSIIEVYR